MHLLCATYPASQDREKVEARDSNDIRIPDGTIKVACASKFARWTLSRLVIFLIPTARFPYAQANERNYALLGYTNARPRTTYLAKLRNPNPDMPDYYDQPLTKVEYKATKPKMSGDYGGHGSDDDHGHDHSHDDSHSGSMEGRING